jgi:hypothetical protein
MPTPRPDTSVTAAAVDSPELNTSCAASSSSSVREAWIAGLHAFLPRLREMPRHRLGQRHAVMRDEGARIREARRVGHGGPGGDRRGVVAGDVADRERDEPRGMRRRGDAPAREGREMLADAVHLADGRAGAQQLAVHRLQVFEREARRGQGRERGAAARDEEEHQVLFRQAAQHPEQFGRRSGTGRIGHRMRAEADRDSARLRRVGQVRAMRGDHEARQRHGRPGALDGQRHLRRRLAHAEHEHAAARRRLGQMGGQCGERIGRRLRRRPEPAHRRPCLAIAPAHRCPP